MTIPGPAFMEVPAVEMAELTTAICIAKFKCTRPLHAFPTKAGKVMHKPWTCKLVYANSASK